QELRPAGPGDQPHLLPEPLPLLPEAPRRPPGVRRRPAEPRTPRRRRMESPAHRPQRRTSAVSRAGRGPARAIDRLVVTAYNESAARQPPARPPAPVAQGIERLRPKEGVGSSNLSGGVFQTSTRDDSCSNRAP